jgi:hypothetical protein
MKLNEVVPWGRSLAEYRAMFNLSEAELSKRILGCGDGPASFNAEMTEQGHSVVSVDPIYQFSADQIRQRVQQTYEPVISQVKQNPDRYVWQTFRNADALGLARLATMEKFLQDYDAGKAAGRYLAQSLPHLSIAHPPFYQPFELCVCSHLLFLYSDQLSLEFHIAAIDQLLQVTQEIRIFPLLQLDCQPSPYLEPVMQDLSDKGLEVELQTVTYEFQKGGNQMLRIIKG